MRTFAIRLAGYALIWLCVSQAARAQEELYQLDIEDLLDVQVTSVSKKAQSLSEAAAAIFVISREDIQRTGVTNIPDALRMAPGLHVARIDANKWAVSARGFNGRFANKLLVLIDGRSIYTQAFSGVYWENQDVMLEDVERIEVIRGPGAALWGANAVNGVINIITRHSADTQGYLLAVGGGLQEQAFGALRYGTQLSDRTTARAYLKGFKRGEFVHQLGDGDAGDDWDKVQGGFRLDSQGSDQDFFTVQGDVYHSHINQALYLPTLTSPDYMESIWDSSEAYGGNLVARLRHTFSPGSEYTLQFYYDFYDRNETFSHETRHTLDIDFQHRFILGDMHDLIWGLNYRYSDAVAHENKSITLSLEPSHRADPLLTGFIQDEIMLLKERLWLTLGSRFEHNNYTGFEFQPTARLMWIPSQRQRAWLSVSKAVRTPSRIEHEMSLTAQVVPFGTTSDRPLALVITGVDRYKSEELMAYEIGYRFRFSKSASVDLTAFYNHYNHLRSLSFGAPQFERNLVTQPLIIANDTDSNMYGLEASSIWQMLDWWRWDLSYSYIKTDLGSSLYPVDATPPQQQVSFRSIVSPRSDVDIDLWLRYTDISTALVISGPVQVEDYITLDIRLAWRPEEQLELSLIGQNLLEQNHLEYVQENTTQATEIERSVFAKLVWQF